MDALGELPRSGPLADFAAPAEVLSRPNGPLRPWVLASSERVIKAYDLRAFDPLERRRVSVEAETALALSNIEGVVKTYRAEEVENWLMIEMERLGESLADLLRRIDAGEAEAPSPARWGALLEEVAATLGRVHRHKIVHRDVKPGNLIFDREGKRLLLADFSIAARVRTDSTEEGVAGTRRYIAPEVFKGRIGYAADQYSLAVTAEEALGEAKTAAAGEVLQRAAEQDPGNRFPAVEDFGTALRAALNDRTPYRLSSRLQRVSPKWRSTWGVGAVTLVAVYLLMVVMRIPHLSWLAGLLIPVLAAVPTMALSRMLYRLRGGRSQPRVPLANQPWIPVLLFVLIILTLRPILANEPGRIGKYALYAWIGALAIPALLGSTPANTGEWLIRRVRRWERWRQGHKRRTGLVWSWRLALIIAALGLSALPAAVGARWPNHAGAPPAGASPAVAAVARSRTAMLAGKPAAACALMRAPSDGTTVPCQTWAPVAGKWLRHDLRERGAPEVALGDLDELAISPSDGSEKYGAPTWAIWTNDGERNYVGMISREDERGSIWAVVIARNRPRGDPLGFQDAYWGYEVVHRDGRWPITGIEICDFSTHDDCARITQVPKSEWKQSVRDGAPGR